jgi:hypothetical protein
MDTTIGIEAPNAGIGSHVSNSLLGLLGCRMIDSIVPILISS